MGAPKSQAAGFAAEALAREQALRARRTLDDGPRTANGATHTEAAPMDPLEQRKAAAEQSVVGALLIGEPFSNVASRVRPEHYSPQHRLILLAIITLATEGKAHDANTVIEQLTRTGDLQHAGGMAYVSELARNTPTGANVETYASTVTELFLWQQLGVRDDGELRQRRRQLQEQTRALAELEALSGAPKQARAPAIDWTALESRVPPEREWAVDHWLGMGHVTLFAGDAGSGKTLLAQALSSCLVTRHAYLDWVPKPRRVLMWACEDDEDELWRRQIAIAKRLEVPLSAFDGHLYLHSYNGQQVELAVTVDQRRLERTPHLTELREQIGDYRADVVLLDNVARLYAGNENDRHQVTSFVAMLTEVAGPAAVVLLGHPGRASGSEFSGSSAWEAAVRSRWYLGRTLPGAARRGGEDDDEAADDGVRYLCRRKANYGPRDWRRLQYLNGVMVPDVEPEGASQGRPGPQFKREVVERAVRKLAEMGEHGVASTNSPKYLPRLAEQFKLLDRLSAREFADTVREMRKDQTLILATVGQYSNRTPREGLVLADDVHKRTAQTSHN